MTRFLRLSIGGLFLCLNAGMAVAKSIKVANPTAFREAVPQLQPGDTLVLAAGTWQDAQLVFKGTGTEQQPIVLRAEKPGAVKLQGRSSLQLAGQYLVVSGLSFQNGYGPGKAVIEFRENSKNLAFNCRVTNCVIDAYNQPDRFKEDTWVLLFGQHNRFDHNYLGGKLNAGVTLVVDLSSEQNQNNYHRIDHNYFGPRPRLGSNGGETMRVGVSTYSLTASHTLIEENYFYRCSGEVEIVSIKSGDNIIRRNLFEECEGGLVLRHGNNNLVEGNYFLGNGKPETGGVRIINAGQRIVGNYFADLKGDRFRAALTVMNGVPGSSINRYHQVRNVTIENNTFVNCDDIELAAGKDLERTAKPENVRFVNNTFYNPQADTLFHIHDDISGISFVNNTIQLGKNPNLTGLTPGKLTLQRSADGLLVPAAGKSKPKLQRPVTAAQTGPAWFRPTTQTACVGKVWAVAAGETDALQRACRTAQAGDIIELTDAGTYPLATSIEVKVPLTVRAKAGLATRPKVAFAGEQSGFMFFSIENGGALRLDGLAFDGTSSAEVADCIIQTSRQPMLAHYSLWVDNCTFANLSDGRKSAFRTTKSTYADTVQFTNSVFDNITGDVLSLAAEKEDKGIYNAEVVVLRNCLFRNILAGALDLYRGGNDESTTGPFLTLDHCTFDNVGNMELGHVLKINGVQWSDIRNCLFNNSGRAGRAIQYEDYGWTINRLSNCNFYQSGKVESFYPLRRQNVTSLPIEFMAPQQLDYRLKNPAPQLPQAADGRPVGFLATR